MGEFRDIVDSAQFGLAEYGIGIAGFAEVVPEAKFVALKIGVLVLSTISFLDGYRRVLKATTTAYELGRDEANPQSQETVE